MSSADSTVTGSASVIEAPLIWEPTTTTSSTSELELSCAITATGISNAKEKIYFKFFIVSPLKKRVFKDYYRHLLLYLSTIVDII